MFLKREPNIQSNKSLCILAVSKRDCILGSLLRIYVELSIEYLAHYKAEQVPLAFVCENMYQEYTFGSFESIYWALMRGYIRLLGSFDSTC